MLKRLIRWLVVPYAVCAHESDSSKTLLLVSSRRCDHNSAIAFSCRKGWRLQVAPNVSAAAGKRYSETIAAVLYDGDTPEMSWQDDLLALIETHTPAFLILLSSTMNEDDRSELIALGGWDLVRRPVALHELAKVVDSCMRLVADVDCAASDGVTKVRALRVDKGTDVR
jgi:DNA-binding response OmpR family regulator